MIAIDDESFVERNPFETRHIERRRRCKARLLAVLGLSRPRYLSLWADCGTQAKDLALGPRRIALVNHAACLWTSQ